MRFSLCLTANLMLLGLTTGFFPGLAQQPNIIFIYADDWGYGDMSLHGHHTITTPNLDQLAAEGSEFLQFNVCNPVCSPSRTAIMTGHYPARHHIHQHFSNHDSNMARNMPDWLDPEALTLPRMLRENGYRTAHFGKWHLTSALIDNAPLTVNYGYDEVRNWHGNGPGVEGPRGESTGTCVDYCMDFIGQEQERPFFINLWIHESHAAIDPPEDAKEAYAHVEEPFRSYYACISYADRELGRLFRFLKDEHLDSTTLVIFSSDNGPEYPSADPAVLTYYSRGETAGLVGQKRSLFEGGVGLPFIVHWPGKVPAGMVNNTTNIAAVDILPSFCKIAGLDLPAEYFPDGEDMSDCLLGAGRQRSKPLFWDWRGPANSYGWPRNAVRSGDWKLLSNEDGSEKYLYNIQASRVEAYDSAAYYPQLTDSLYLLLRDWKAALPVNIPMGMIRFHTDKTGRQLIIDFSAAAISLNRISEPEFRLYNLDTGKEIPIDSVRHDSQTICLFLDEDRKPGQEDRLSLSFRSGEIIAENGASLLFFSMHAVENRIDASPELFSLGFKVLNKADGSRLPDVWIRLDTLMLATNLNGQAFFEMPAGKYFYEAQKDTYKPVQDSLDLHSDTLISLQLQPTLASAKFRVSDGNAPLGNTEVVIGGRKNLTNLVGITHFEDLVIGEPYPWTITKTGYMEAKDTLVLLTDTTVQVVLSPTSGVSGKAAADLKVFPNPAREILFLKSAWPIENMQLFTVECILAKETKCTALESNISIAGMEPGVYLLKITIQNPEKGVICKRINLY